MKKRVIGVFLMIALTLQSGVSVSAANNFEEEKPALGTGYVLPEVEEISNIEIADIPVTYSSTEVQQSYYRTPNLPAVRNQESYGLCWAFSTIGCIEINLMKKGYGEFDLSELHLGYFTYHSVEDALGGLEGDDYTYAGTDKTFLDAGGNAVYAANALMDWLGAASESTVPYSMATSVADNGISEDLAFQDVVHLQGMKKLSASNMAAMKQAIVDYGSVQVNYFTLANWGSDMYYNASKAAQYCYLNGTGVNHGVVVVGWDDTYSASNFITAPEGDGAWIVRNSWGSDWGDEGYFYLSYYDKSIDDVIYVFDAGLADNYDNNYQYDGAILSVGGASFGQISKAANVFQAKANADGAEVVRGVSFESWGGIYSYEVDVYKNLTDMENPESGEWCTSVSGELWAEGTFTIPLNEQVYVDEGGYYSIVITLTAQDDNNVSLTCDAAYNGSLFDSKSAAKEHQSYLYQSNRWTDFGESSGRNFRIKAYTDNVDKRATVAVSSISLDKKSITLNVGDTETLTSTVNPSDATNKAILWYSSNEAIATVDSSGRITAQNVGTVTITAQSVVNESVKATCTVSVKQPLTGIGFDYASIIMNPGGTTRLAINYYPTNTTDDKTVTWSSSDDNVATVSSDGLITAKELGTAVITAKVGARTAQIIVTVEAAWIKSVQITGDTDIINPGESIQLRVTYYPSNATNNKIIWSSSDTSIATVDANGKVTGLKKGKVIIRATASDRGTVYDEFSINVKPILVSSVRIDATEMPVRVGDTRKFTVTVSPTNAYDRSVIWSSSDTSIATIDASGNFKAVGTGSVTIIAIANDGGGASTTYTFTVLEGKKAEESSEPSNPDSPDMPDTSDKTETVKNGMVTEVDGNRYWYENGVKQGLEGRGKEIFDPVSNAWYWLDKVLDGAVATNKDVYQESLAGIWGDIEGENGERYGKWVRYDENGHMIKGWSENENGRYYFDLIFGTMAKGYATIEGIEYYFDPATGVLIKEIGEVPENGWKTIDGNDYWYENYNRQGYSVNGSYRGKEIFDGASNAWYWLDNVDGGKKATSKDVYQESLAGDWGDINGEDGQKYGKWVRYNESGHMIKGWQYTAEGTYYFDLTYGTMAKGDVVIDGKNYSFDVNTGKLK